MWGRSRRCFETDLSSTCTVTDDRCSSICGSNVSDQPFSQLETGGKRSVSPIDELSRIRIPSRGRSSLLLILIQSLIGLQNSATSSVLTARDVVLFGEDGLHQPP